MWSDRSVEDKVVTLFHLTVSFCLLVAGVIMSNGDDEFALVFGLAANILLIQAVVEALSMVENQFYALVALVYTLTFFLRIVVFILGIISASNIAENSGGLSASNITGDAGGQSEVHIVFLVSLFIQAWTSFYVRSDAETKYEDGSGVNLFKIGSIAILSIALIPFYVILFFLYRCGLFRSVDLRPTDSVQVRTVLDPEERKAEGKNSREPISKLTGLIILISITIDAIILGISVKPTVFADVSDSALAATNSSIPDVVNDQLNFSIALILLIFNLSATSHHLRIFTDDCIAETIENDDEDEKEQKVYDFNGVGNMFLYCTISFTEQVLLIILTVFAALSIHELSSELDKIQLGLLVAEIFITSIKSALHLAFSTDYFDMQKFNLFVLVGCCGSCRVLFFIGLSAIIAILSIPRLLYDAFNGVNSGKWFNGPDWTEVGIFAFLAVNLFEASGS